MKLWQVGSLALAAFALFLVGCRDAAKADATVVDGPESSELTADSELVSGEDVVGEEEYSVEENRPAEEMTSELSAGAQPEQPRQSGSGGPSRAQTAPPAAQAPAPVSEDAKKFVGEYVGIVTPESRTRFSEMLRNRELPQERIPEVVDQAARVFESMTIILLASGDIQAKIGEDVTIDNFGTWSAQGDTVRLNMTRGMPMGRRQGGEGGPAREGGAERRGSEGAPREANPQRQPAEGQEGRRRMTGGGQQNFSVRARWDASRNVLSPVDTSDLIGEFRKVK